MTRGGTRGSNVEVLFGRKNSWSHASRSFFVLRLCCGILYAQAVGNFWTQDDVFRAVWGFGRRRVRAVIIPTCSVTRADAGRRTRRTNRMSLAASVRLRFWGLIWFQ